MRMNSVTCTIQQMVRMLWVENAANYLGSSLVNNDLEVPIND